HVVKKVGPDASLGLDNEVLNFDHYFGHTPAADEVWYRDIAETNGGDGTVPRISSAPSWLTGADIVVQDVGATGHTELITHAQGEKKFLDAFGVSYTDATISTTKAKSSLGSLETAI